MTTISTASLYFDTESRKLLEHKFGISSTLASRPFYILFSKDANNQNTTPIIRTDGFFLECYDGADKVKEMLEHNNAGTNQDLLLSATCSVNDVNGKLNIYHASPAGRRRDIVTAYGPRNSASPSSRSPTAPPTTTSRTGGARPRSAAASSGCRSFC